MSRRSAPPPQDEPPTSVQRVEPPTCAVCDDDVWLCQSLAQQPCCGHRTMMHAKCMADWFHDGQAETCPHCRAHLGGDGYPAKLLSVFHGECAHCHTYIYNDIRDAPRNTGDGGCNHWMHAACWDEHLYVNNRCPVPKSNGEVCNAVLTMRSRFHIEDEQRAALSGDADDDEDEDDGEGSPAVEGPPPIERRLAEAVGIPSEALAEAVGITPELLAAYQERGRLTAQGEMRTRVGEIITLRAQQQETRRLEAQLNALRPPEPAPAAPDEDDDALTARLLNMVARALATMIGIRANHEEAPTRLRLCYPDNVDFAIRAWTDPADAAGPGLEAYAVHRRTDEILRDELHTEFGEVRPDGVVRIPHAESVRDIMAMVQCLMRRHGKFGTAMLEFDSRGPEYLYRARP